MYRFVLALVAVLSAATVVQSQGIAARSTAESLRGLNGVHVVVEEMIPEVRSAGLTAAGIKSAVEDRLLKSGIPILGLGELTMDPRGPTLLIQVDFVAADPIYFYNSQIQFFQNVTLNTGNQEIAAYASASTWQTSKVDKAGKFRLPTLPQEVVKQVDHFVAAYLSMNEPAAKEEVVEESEDATAEKMDAPEEEQ